MNWMLVAGAGNMGLAVLLGAFGAHALRAREATLPLEAGLASWETAVQYHLAHALGLLALGLIARWLDGALLQWSGGLIAAGILFFCGSLYLMTLTGWRGLGPVTPLGGVCLIAGWAVLVAALLRHGH